MAESLIKGNRIKLGGRARQSPFFFLFIYFSFHFHLLFFSSYPISLSPHHPILPELRDKRGEREREAIIDSDVRCECCGRSLTEKMGGATISFFSPSGLFTCLLLPNCCSSKMDDNDAHRKEWMANV